MKKLIVSTIIGLVAMCASVSLNAQVEAGDPPQWSLSLGGGGATSVTGDSQTLFDANISLGRTGTLLLPVEYGIRQGFGYSSADEGNVLFDTHAYFDATVIRYKKLDVFLGVNAGLIYGDTPTVWTGGPEAGLRFWLKKDVAIVGRLEYPFDFDDWRSEDTLRYWFGASIRF